MIDAPLLDELFEIRQRLSDQCDGDFARYARMLQETPIPVGMPTRTEPLFPQSREYPQKASA